MNGVDEEEGTRALPLWLLGIFADKDVFTFILVFDLSTTSSNSVSPTVLNRDSTAFAGRY